MLGDIAGLFACRRAKYHKGHSVTINGVEYVSLKQLADKLGLAHTSMAYRWKKYQRGEISEKELMSKKHSGKNTLTSKNKWFWADGNICFFYL